MELQANITDAFDVLTAMGLAAIIGDQRPHVTLHWTDRRQAVLNVEGMSDTQVAERVQSHAADHADDSWMTEVIDLDGKPRAPLSPRIGMPVDDAAWGALELGRLRVIDALPGETRGDHRLIGALGRPAYWAVAKDRVRVDNGASAWEMKTRNRGEEFVQNRLALLARSVGSRPNEHIEEGLRGEATRDEVGKGGLDSRTPTGLRAPGPADNARAWCALWGISVFPVRAIVSPTPYMPVPSRTAGVIRASGRRWFGVPIPGIPVSIARLRAATRSAALSRTLAALVDVEVGGAVPASGAQWLQRYGFVGVSMFEQHRTDNVNAPEAWLLPGRYFPLSTEG